MKNYNLWVSILARFLALIVWIVAMQLIPDDAPQYINLFGTFMLLSIVALHSDIDNRR